MQDHDNNSLYFSLLSPHEMKGFDISGNTQNDLAVDFIGEKISKNNVEQRSISKILLDMPTDKEVIDYRRTVYSDLRDHLEVCEKMYDIFDSLRYYTRDRINRISEGSTIYELLTRLKSLESYIYSVTELNKVTDGVEFKSEGMKNFVDMIHRIYKDSGFDELSKDIEIISKEISNVRSITIGVNLDSNFCPREAGITSLNSYWFDEQSVIKRFLKYQRKNQISDKELMPFTFETHNDDLSKVTRRLGYMLSLKEGSTLFSKSDSASDSPLMNNLTKIIERMLPSMTAKIKNMLNKYVDISGQKLGTLADEVLFYLRFIELEKKLNDIGMPTCCGEYSEKDTHISDLYNLKLAICKLDGTIEDDIVCNDIDFTNDKTIQILTGPNRGGKTILTQGIGLAYLMYQSGVFVPAAKADIEPCDGIYTHFPVEEEKTVSLGRLGEESERFNEISKTASGRSLILFNESFATTSHTESLYIAEDVVRYLCCLGARTIFNTHMHELGENAEELSKHERSVCKAVSVVMGGGEGERSYKIHYKKPDGKSYAHEIAYKYGITFEQLSERLG